MLNKNNLICTCSKSDSGLTMNQIHIPYMAEDRSDITSHGCISQYYNEQIQI